MEPVEKTDPNAQGLVAARRTLCIKTQVKLGWLEGQLESRLLASDGGVTVIRIKHCAHSIRDIQISEEANTAHCK